MCSSGEGEDVLGGPLPTTSRHRLRHAGCAAGSDRGRSSGPHPRRSRPDRTRARGRGLLARRGRHGRRPGAGRGAPGHDGDARRGSPFLDDVLAQPVSAARLRSRLARAAQQRAPVRGLEQALARQGRDLHELNKIGVALSAQRDIRKLLELILTRSRELTAADAGSLYLVERGKDHDGTDGRPAPLQVDPERLGDGAVRGVHDARSPRRRSPATPRSPARRSTWRTPTTCPPARPSSYGRSFDERSGYRTKSMLSVPMRDHKGEVIGVVQLINKKRDPARRSCTPARSSSSRSSRSRAVDEELVTSLASQAAVAHREQRGSSRTSSDLFDGFVSASVTAIESRDPTTSGHSARVAHAHGRPRRSGGRARRAGPSATCTSRATSSRRSATRACCTTSARSACARRCWSRGRSSTSARCSVIRQRFAYIQRTLEAEHYKAQLDALRARPRRRRRSLARAGARLRAAPGRARRDARDDRDRQRAADPGGGELPRRSWTSPRARTRTRTGGRQPYLTPNEVAGAHHPARAACPRRSGARSRAT